MCEWLDNINFSILLKLILGSYVCFITFQELLKKPIRQGIKWLSKNLFSLKFFMNIDEHVFALIYLIPLPTSKPVLQEKKLLKMAVNFLVFSFWSFVLVALGTFFIC